MIELSHALAHQTDLGFRLLNSEIGNDHQQAVDELVNY